MQVSNELLSTARVVVEAEKRDLVLPSVFLFGSFSMWHSRTSLICTQGEETSFSYRGRSNERPDWAEGYNRQLLIATAEARVRLEGRDLPVRLNNRLTIARLCFAQLWKSW